MILPLPRGHSLAGALRVVALGAAARDAAPAFPGDALDALEAAGALALTVPSTGRPAPTPAEEWALVRAVARADGSVSRILDGHLNAVERLSLLAPEPLRSGELTAVAAGRRRLGVWGADPAPGHGEPAVLVEGADGPALRGVKVFCSGAGGLDRALVTARRQGWDRPALAYVDLGAGVEIDRGWYRASGLRASESHRVRFNAARVLAVLGGPGELTREPWFGRDALRTAATWAGLADATAEDALDELAALEAPGDLQALAAGRMLTTLGTVDAWLGEAARVATAEPERALWDLSVRLREGVAGACRLLADEAARVCGARALTAGGTLDRARRDLDVFLLQHRLDPLVARVGHAALEARR